MATTSDEGRYDITVRSAGLRRRRITEKAFAGLGVASAGIAVGILALVLGTVIHKGMSQLSLDFFTKAMGRPAVLSSHRVHHPEIDLTSETTATGTWALEDVFIDEDAGVTVRGAAFYEDQYVKVGGTWKIKHTGYARTYEEIENRKQMPWLTISQRAS